MTRWGCGADRAAGVKSDLFLTNPVIGAILYPIYRKRVILWEDFRPF